MRRANGGWTRREGERGGRETHTRGRAHASAVVRATEEERCARRCSRRVSTGSRLESRANYPLLPSLLAPFPPCCFSLFLCPPSSFFFTLLLLQVPLARPTDRPTVCLPTYLPIYLLRSPSTSLPSLSSSSFSSCSPFFARCQVRSLYTIGPSYNPSTPFPFAPRSNFALPLNDSAPPFVHELGRGSVSLSLFLSCSLM